MQLLKILLKRIQNGERSFAPENENEIDEFQSTAKRLLFAHENGYIEKMSQSKSYRVAGGLVNAVIISGGLTFKGERYLEQANNDINTANQSEDIIEVKPSFWGVSININALCRKWRKKN